MRSPTSLRQCNATEKLAPVLWSIWLISVRGGLPRSVFDKKSSHQVDQLTFISWGVSIQKLRGQHLAKEATQVCFILWYFIFIDSLSFVLSSVTVKSYNELTNLSNRM